ncbi:MAG TPA: hypothetical protein VGF67_04485 [Ktedonobacteraceae bacterium]|jgi:hypothetical protein
MEKQTYLASVQPASPSLILSDVQDDELKFFQRFVRQHGGAIVPMGRSSWYRLEFPPGTQRLPNDERDPQMNQTCRLQYPDGAGLIWYRLLMVDGVLRARVLLVPGEHTT